MSCAPSAPTPPATTSPVGCRCRRRCPWTGSRPRSASWCCCTSRCGPGCAPPTTGASTRSCTPPAASRSCPARRPRTRSPRPRTRCATSCSRSRSTPNGSGRCGSASCTSAPTPTTSCSSCRTPPPTAGGCATSSPTSPPSCAGRCRRGTCGSPWRRPRSRSRTVAAAATPPPAAPGWTSWAAARRASSRRARAGSRRPRSRTRCSTPPRWAWPWTGSRRPCPSARPPSSSPRRPRPPPGSPASTRPSSRSSSTTGSCPAWPAA